MKNILPLIILACTLHIGFCQNTIKVDVKKACNENFDLPITIELYKKENTQEVLIESKTENPAVFNISDLSKQYIVKVNSTDNSTSNVGIKDLAYIRRLILGQIPWQNSSAIISDANNSAAVSTLDLVLWTRHLIKLSNVNSNYWVFLDKEINNNSNLSEYINKSTVSEIKSGENLVEFLAYQNGEISSTYEADCIQCNQDSTAFLKFFPDIHEFKANNEYNISLSFLSNKKILGFVESLKHKDITQLTVSQASPSTITFNHKEDEQAIHFLGFYEGNPLLNERLLNISFIPNRDGNFKSFFSINNDFDSEAVYEEGNCFKLINKKELVNQESTIIFWPENIIIPTCDVNLYETGKPSTALNLQTVSFSFTDQITYHPSKPNQCTINRTWTALNWVTSELFVHIQVISTNDDIYLPICLKISVLVQGPTTLHVKDIIRNPYANDIYAFSLNPADSIIVLTPDLPLIEYVKVYHLSSNNFCISEINKIVNVPNCNINWPLDINVPDCDIQYYATGFPSTDVTCENTLNFTYLDVKIGEGTANCFVERTWTATHNQTGEKFFHTQIIKVVKNLPFFELICYDEDVIKDQEIEVPFFSTNFNGLLGFQGAISVKDAFIVKASSKNLKEIMFNPQLYNSSFLWVKQTQDSDSYRETDPLFALTIKVLKNNSLSGMLNIAENILSSEAILNNLEATKISLGFRVIKRSTSNITPDVSEKINIFPNPINGDVFNIESSIDRTFKLSIYSQSGSVVHHDKIQLNKGINTVNVLQPLSSGLYIVKLESDHDIFFRKLMVVK